jgi:plastocyanin
MLLLRALRVSLRFFAACVLPLALVGAEGGTAAAAAPQQWHALVGTDTADHAIQGNAFFPGDVSIHVGDTIIWSANAGEIHTVSFEYGPPPPNLSGFDVVTTPAGGTTFGGTGWFNSGLLSTAEGLPTSYALAFSATGNFTFHCLVHETMQGTLHVLGSNQPLPHDQAFYTRQGISQQNQLLAQGRQQRAVGLSSALSASTPSVTAGAGELFPTSSDAVLQFLPDSKTIRVGETVTWSVADPETPHTITFGPEPPGGGLFAGLLPIGTDSPGHATIAGPVGSTINSGFLAKGVLPFPTFGSSFRVTFKATGTYQYRCLLHDDLGMVGSITVLPVP